MNRNHFLTLATLALLMAAFLRLWQLATYPPGPHYDEAVNLLITRSVAFGGANFFPMVEAYQGREVLYYYLGAPLIRLVSDSMFSFHVLNVFCNLITIAASMALGRALFRGRRGVLVGLIVGVLMAVSFPQIWLARQAFRAVTLPMMQALALLFLWKGLRARRAQRAVFLLLIAGVFAGGAVYTYNSSRLFPLWLLIGWTTLVWFDRAHWRQRAGQAAVFFGALAISAAPMAIYAFQRPDVFFGRLAEVTQVDQSVSLAQSILLHLEMFFIAGDPYFRYNVAARPYFTLPEGLLLLIGIVIAAVQLTRRIHPLERAAYLLAFLSPLMVIPSVIAVGGLPPSHMRSLGMVPLIFVLVALGGERAISRLHQRVRMQHDAPLLTALVVGVLLIVGVLVGDLYFRWAGSAALFYETDADLAAAARWLVDHQVDADTPVYVAARDKGHPTVMIESVPSLTWLGTDSLFRPAPGKAGLVIFPHSAPPPSDWAAWLEAGEVENLPPAPDGQPAFRAFNVSGDAELPVEQSTFEARSPYLTYKGMRGASIAAGGEGAVVMAWQIDATPAAGDLTPLIQLEDRHGNVLARGDAYMAGTDQWRVGETLLQRMIVRVPPATPPGEYMLRVAWVERANDRYIPYFNAQGGLGAVWSEIGTLFVTRPTTFPDPAGLAMDVRQPTEVVPGVVLLGWDAPPTALRPGETLPLTIYWQAVGESRESFMLRALFVNEANEVELWSGVPVDNRYPADEWVTGEILSDRLQLTVPREQTGGDYRLVLMIGEAQIELRSITVEGITRAFDPPQVDHVTHANFGAEMLLYGYSVGQSEGKFSLELIWKALDNIAVDYKVFVHLVSRDGVVLTQRDAMPRSDSYPTSLWRSGEYVVDVYELPDIEDAVTVRVGLYDPETGIRLPLQGTAGDYIEIVDLRADSLQTKR